MSLLSDTWVLTCPPLIFHHSCTISGTQRYIVLLTNSHSLSSSIIRIMPAVKSKPDKRLTSSKKKVENSSKADDDNDMFDSQGATCDTENCATCGKVVLDSQKGVKCDLCEFWFHTGCEKVSYDVYDFLSMHADEKSLQWFCGRCAVSSRKLLGFLQGISNAQKCLEEKLEMEQKKMEDKVDKILDVLEGKKDETWAAVVERSDKQLAGVEDRLNKHIENRIKVVEVLCQSLPGGSTKSDVNESIAAAVRDKIEEDKEEEAEIAKRKTSAIVFGLSESISDDIEERIMEDSCKISEMLHEMNVSDVGVRQVIRLGARRPVMMLDLDP